MQTPTETTLAKPNQTTPRTRLLLLAYAAALLLLALFALSALRPPLIAVSESDAQETNYRGLRDAVNGDFIGRVEVTFANGGQYLGSLGEAGFTGQASYSGDDDWTISGLFVNGYLQSEANYSDSLGSYQGNFSRSIPHGKGVYTSKQGWHYEGDFLYGKVSGQGTLTFADGSSLEGNFEDGVFMGQSE